MGHASSRPVFAAERAARRAVTRALDRSLAFYAAHPAEIPARLDALDREMDIERAMDVYALRAAALGGALSLLRARSWVLLPLAAAAMLALQAATGDSALRVVLRRRGFRTAAEIEAESHALSALLEREEGRAPAPSPTRRTGPDAAPI